MAGEGLHPGPQSKSMVFYKNQMWPRRFKPYSYTDPEPLMYTLKTVGLNVRRWGKQWALVGVASAIGVTFFFEWQEVLKHVPLINWPYKGQQESKNE